MRRAYYKSVMKLQDSYALLNERIQRILFSNLSPVLFVHLQATGFSLAPLRSIQYRVQSSEYRVVSIGYSVLTVLCLKVLCLSTHISHFDNSIYINNHNKFKF